MSRPPQGNSLRSLAGQVAFRVADTPYYWEDVLLAAQTRGDWYQLEAEVREGIACLRHLRASGEVIAEDAVEEVARAFREPRQLYSAADAEAWLAERGVSVGNWFKYLRRCVLRQQSAERLPKLVARYPAAEAQVHRALKIVGICSGHLARFGRHLAGIAAVHERLRNEGDNPTPTAESQRAAPSLAVDLVQSKPLGLAPERLRERCEILARIAHSLERFRPQVLTSEAIRRHIAARHIDWIRLECLSLSFADEPAAREAALCIRQDGEDLQGVASRARTVVRRELFRLEEVEPALHSTFLGGRKGELLGPLPLGPEYRLCLVSDKILPSEEDPVTRQRAEQELLQSALDREMSLRVEWLQRLD
jgi:hypothetical protein